MRPDTDLNRTSTRFRVVLRVEAKNAETTMRRIFIQTHLSWVLHFLQAFFPLEWMLQRETPLNGVTMVTMWHIVNGSFRMQSIEAYVCLRGRARDWVCIDMKACATIRFYMNSHRLGVCLIICMIRTCTHVNQWEPSKEKRCGEKTTIAAFFSAVLLRPLM